LNERIKRGGNAAWPAAACTDHALIRRVLRHFIPAAPADNLNSLSPPQSGELLLFVDLFCR